MSKRLDTVKEALKKMKNMLDRPVKDVGMRTSQKLKQHMNGNETRMYNYQHERTAIGRSNGLIQKMDDEKKLKERAKRDLKAQVKQQGFEDAFRSAMRDALGHMVAQGKIPKLSEKLKQKIKQQRGLQKSNYPGYNPKDNIKRKMRNTGEELVTLGPNRKPKRYTTTGSALSDASAKSTEKRIRKESLKRLKTKEDFSPEELKAMAARANEKEQKKKEKKLLLFKSTYFDSALSILMEALSKADGASVSGLYKSYTSNKSRVLSNDNE